MVNVHVIAVLGDQPGVVTELLWHLVQRGDHVSGLEIWTTAGSHRSGAEALQRKRSLFDKLHQLLGARSANAPTLPDPIRASPPPEEVLDGRRVRVVAFHGADGPLVDIRAEADAEVVDRQLHDRVRQLRRLSAEVRLVGLIGGRKTMGAALQTAFALHARQGDELVHVLVHPKIEADGALLAQFACPDPALADLASMDAQISVHQVPFLRIRSFLAAHERLVEDLDTAAYDDLWRTLRRLDRGFVEPVLRATGSAHILEGRAGSERISLTLRLELGRTYRGLVGHPAGATEEVLERESQGGRPYRHVVERKTASVRRQLQRIVREFREHAAGRVLEGFVPIEADDGTWSVPRAAELTLIDP